MNDNQKTEKTFDIDKLDLPEKAVAQAPEAPSVPDPAPLPDPAPPRKKPRPDHRKTDTPPRTPITRPAKIFLTVLLGATVLVWSFLLLIYLWESVLS